MMKLKALLVPASLVFLAACSGPKVHYDFDAKTPFAQYRTYDWQAAPREAKAKGAGFGGPLMEARVKRAVEAEMAAKGFRKETAGDPDVLIAYYPTLDAVRRSGGRVGIGVGLSPFRGLGVGVGTTVGGRHRQRVGSIVLEVEDFKSRQLVWSAVAEGVLRDGLEPEDAERDVAEAVKELLTRFPPRP